MTHTLSASTNSKEKFSMVYSMHTGNTCLSIMEHRTNKKHRWVELYYNNVGEEKLLFESHMYDRRLYIPIKSVVMYNGVSYYEFYRALVMDATAKTFLIPFNTISYKVPAEELVELLEKKITSVNNDGPAIVLVKAGDLWKYTI